MDDEEVTRQELERLHDELAQARLELRRQLHRAGDDVLATVRTVEREVERIECSSRCPSCLALELAIFRLRQIAVTLAEQPQASSSLG